MTGLNMNYCMNDILLLFLEDASQNASSNRNVIVYCLDIGFPMGKRCHGIVFFFIFSGDIFIMQFIS